MSQQPIPLPVERITDSLWNDSMTPEDFQKFYPLLIDWLRTTLATYAGRTQTVASRAFPRLPLYFTAETLALRRSFWSINCQSRRYPRWD